MSDRQGRLDALLIDLMKVHGALGASLVSRDGLCVRSVGLQALGRETVSAMTATLMGASEIALSELDGTKARHVIAQTDNMKILIIGATPDLLLVTAMPADVATQTLLPGAEAAASKVAGIVAG